jgi:hypothetical protein
MSQPTLYISHTDFRTRLQKQAVSIQMDDWATIAEFYRLGTAGEIPPEAIQQQHRWRRFTWFLWLTSCLAATWLSTGWVCWWIIGAILMTDALFQNAHGFVLQRAVNDPIYYAALVAAKTLRLRPRRTRPSPPTAKELTPHV